MSNLAFDDQNRPTLTKAAAQSDADAAIAAFVSELQQGWDQHDAAISNRHFSADVTWGSPYGAVVHGYDQLHAIHTRLKRQATSGAASRYEIIRAFAVFDGVVVAHVARYALDPKGHPIEPSPDTTGAFSEMALYVLVRRDGVWWLAAGQNTPLRPGGARVATMKGPRDAQRAITTLALCAPSSFCVSRGHTSILDTRCQGVSLYERELSRGEVSRKEKHMTSQTWRVRACEAERPTNPDPLTMHPGDRVEITGQEEDGWVWCRNGAGKEDWVPLSYLTGEGGGTTRTALAEYDSTVFSVEVGEEFQAVLEEHGWLWCENAQGKWGWVRLAHVERLAEA